MPLPCRAKIFARRRDEIGSHRRRQSIDDRSVLGIKVKDDVIPEERNRLAQYASHGREGNGVLEAGVLVYDFIEATLLQRNPVLDRL